MGAPGQSTVQTDTATLKRAFVPGVRQRRRFLRPGETPFREAPIRDTTKAPVEPPRVLPISGAVARREQRHLAALAGADALAAAAVLCLVALVSARASVSLGALAAVPCVWVIHKMLGLYD